MIKKVNCKCIVTPELQSYLSPGICVAVLLQRLFGGVGENWEMQGHIPTALVARHGARGKLPSLPHECFNLELKEKNKVYGRSSFHKAQQAWLQKRKIMSHLLNSLNMSRFVKGDSIFY